MGGAPRFTRTRREELLARRDELRCGYGYQNHRQLPYFQQRPLCPDGDLCIYCEYVLHEMIWPLENEDPKADTSEQGCAGWIDHLISTKGCLFCRFIVDIFFSACPGFPANEIVEERSRRRFCAHVSQVRQLAVGNTQPRPQQWDWHCSVTLQEVSDYDLEPGTFTPFTPAPSQGFMLDIGSVMGAKELFGEQLLPGAAIVNIARPIFARWNCSLFKDALTTCRASHGALCEGPVKVLGRYEQRSRVPSVKPNGIRVVDVQDMAIVDLPAESDYLALSYCWAPEPYTMLTKTNLQALGKPRGLCDLGLAPTITDAITVTRELSERFIWVDSLCIVQDDGNDKAKQLGHMDDIYRLALLTIVAATSSTDGSDGGISGVRPSVTRTEQQSINIRGLRLRQNPPDLDWALRNGRWHSRAWTFQEYFLSRRLLIFMPAQAYFKCEHFRFCESYIDHCCLGAAANQIRASSMVPCCERTISDVQVDGRRDEMPLNYNNSYEDLVGSYTKRQMTYGIDALNAVRGFLSLLYREQGVGFVCGMPVPHLADYFLTWQPRSLSKRRECTTLLDTRFPSWSWAGWEGEVAYPHSLANNDDLSGFTSRGIEVDLECMVSNLSFIPAERSVVPERRSRREVLESCWALSTPLQPHVLSEEAVVDLMTKDSGSLAFNAETASLEISQSAYGRPSDWERSDARSVCRQIIVDSIQVGVVIPHYTREWYAPQFDDNYLRDDQLTFIALSRSTHRWSMWYPFVENMPTSDENFFYENDEDGYVEHPPFDESVYALNGLVVNVMLISTDEDGISSRAGIGQIHGDAWDAAQRSKRRVLLG